MRSILKLLWVFLLCLTTGTAFAGNTKWSVMLYAATAEKELAKYIDPVLADLINLDMPYDTELLMQYDTFSGKAIKRITKRGQGHHKNEIKELPKQDSASPVVFADFLHWASHTARGEKKLLMVLTHSWGWQGIVLNEDFPGEPDKFSIMPIRVFADVIERAPLKFDVAFLDACIDGNAEIVEDLKNIAPYLVVSQRETPFCSFPFQTLFQMFAGTPNIEPRELARALPLEYAKAYSRGGSMAKKEGEFDIVTVFSLDTKKWDPFVDEFAGFVSLLAKKGIKNSLKLTPKWFDNVVDGDSNIDLVEFLQRVPQFMKGDREVAQGASKLLTLIGYPKAASDFSSEKMQINKAQVASFVLAMEADNNIPDAKLLAKSKERWGLCNQDILKNLPPTTQYAIQTIDNKKHFTVQSRALMTNVELRPWLPGCKNIVYRYVDRRGRTQKKKLQREKDFVFVPEFPESSFLLSEAHTNGAPFIHGIGLMLEPTLSTEDMHDPEKGVDYYKKLAWNQRTGWGDAVLIGEKKKPGSQPKLIRRKRGSQERIFASEDSSQILEGNPF